MLKSLPKHGESRVTYFWEKLIKTLSIKTVRKIPELKGKIIDKGKESTELGRGEDSHFKIMMARFKLFEPELKEVLSSQEKISNLRNYHSITWTGWVRSLTQNFGSI